METLREGRNFSALRVKAIQHKNVICHVTASFQAPEEGFDHQSAMPQVPGPEQCIDEPRNHVKSGADFASKA